MSRLKDNDEFGNRMKAYEAVETSRKLNVSLPIYARIDGRSFSKFTKGMKKPFDEKMSNAMIETTKYLVDKTHAKIGYTQSDEISLCWLAEENSDIFFSGKLLKMTSVLASMAATKFARVCPEGYEDRLPHFDCRVFQLPSKIETANAFLWRVMDARKNAISMAAQAHFSPKELQSKRQKDMLEMLESLNVNFYEYPGFFKNGSFVKKRNIKRYLSKDELLEIPECFRPTDKVIRSEITVINDVFFKEIEDKIGFIFNKIEEEI